ncbi:MAG: KGK domain-containing protein [Halothece sp. Uz-M2-17]|nr:KGK domain-containing protein [Halothece sp. Uz-M2-17]
MEDKTKQMEWEDDDVIAFSDKNIIKLSEMISVIKEAATNNDYLSSNIKAALRERLKLSDEVDNIDYRKWFEDGVDCKIMRAYDSKGWQKGKIRVKLSIEFEILEEINQTDSPLNNFR